MNAISNLVGLLLVIAIVVAVFVSAGMIVSSVIQKSTPKAVDLIVENGEAILSDNTLIVRLVITPIGTESVSVTSIKVYKGLSEIDYTSSKVYGSVQLRPGDTYEVIIIFYDVSGISSGDTLTIIIEWKEISTDTLGASKYHVYVISR